MKLSVILILLGMFYATASINAQQMKVDLNLKSTTLNKVLWKLEEKADVVFFYSNEDKVSEIVMPDLNFKNEAVSKILSYCLKNTNLTYRFEHNVVVITKKKESAQQKSVTVKGKVTDNKKNPLPGVSVVVKGTNLGVATDTKGQYKIEFPDNGKVVLVFSFMGMKKQEITVGKKTKIDVILQEDTKEMEEVIVTGIFKRKAESFTGSAVTVKSEELERVGNGNLFQSLKNLDPSLNIMSSMEFGSDPNRLPDIQLRGTSTFPAGTAGDLKGNYQNDPNQPLFILDGFEVSATTVFDFDMERVRSVTILKDAAAKAIYGSKASNGVIVIETQRPLSGELLVTYKGSADITMPDLTSYDLCNAAEKLEIERIAGVYKGWSIPTMVSKTRLYNKRLKKTLEGDDTYWLSKPLTTGIGTKHSLAIELGEQKTKLIGNFSYKNIEGVMKGSGRTNIAGSMSVQYRYKNFLFRNSMSVNSNKSNDSPYGSFGEYARMNPYWDAYNEDGTVALSEEYDNPLYNATINTSLKSSYFEFINNFYTEWTINEGLKAIARIGIVSQRSDADKFYPANHTMFKDYEDKDFFRRGSYQLNKGKFDYLSGDFNIQYSKQIDKHFIMSNIGFNLGEKTSSEVVNYAEGFPSDKMNDMGFALQYAIDKTPLTNENSVREIGFLGVLGYTYDDRFLSDLTIRENASSHFGANNRWGRFWSFGLGWNLHKEKFMDGLDWMKLFKIRGTVGTTGSQNFQSYQAISTYKYYGDRSYNGQIGAYVRDIANEDLKWQQKLDYEAGIDAELGRFKIVFSYYRSFTEDLITSLATATSIGYSTVRENIGRVKNDGFDFSFKYLVLNNDNGFLNLNFAAVTNENEIVELSDAMRKFNEDQDKIANKGDYGSPIKKYVEGGSMNSIWAVPSLGIDPTTGREIYLKKNGTTTYDWDPQDQIIAGNSLPKIRGNFGINGEYKGLGFSCIATFLTGCEMYNYTLVNKVENIDVEYNVDRRVLTGRWSVPGQYAAYKTLAPYYNSENVWIDAPMTKATTRFVQDRSELNISSISLYYEFKKAWIKKYGLQRLKLAFNMNDVYQLSSIKIERGTIYPFARTMSFSLRATF